MLKNKTGKQMFDEGRIKNIEIKQEIKENLYRKDYLLTIYKTGDPGMSHGNPDKQVLPSRSYACCSLDEIPNYINHMKSPFWEHPDLLDDLSNSEDIPFEEKVWGIYTDIVISPLSEELEKGYIARSEDGSIETYRRVNKL